MQQYVVPERTTGRGEPVESTTRGASWHERPLLAPFVYAISTAVMGMTSYAFVYILTHDMQKALSWFLVMDAALLAYLMACSISATKGEQ